MLLGAAGRLGVPGLADASCSCLPLSSRGVLFVCLCLIFSQGHESSWIRAHSEYDVILIWR